MLKKSTSFLLSVIVLAQSFNIQLSDILKLGDLIEHMQFHESTYGDGIFAFVSKHYGNKKIEHKGAFGGDHEHEKLPFNHRVSFDTGYLFVFQSNPEVLDFHDLPFVEKADYSYHNFYSYLENTEIFQPPRKA